MKIILEAFGKRLRSEVMEWPERTPMDISLPLDMDTLVVKPGGYGHDVGYDEVPTQSCIGRFRSKRMFACLPDGEFAEIYTLIGIDKL